MDKTTFSVAGKRSILVVDDEMLVVAFIRDFLKKRAYTVIPAYDGDQAFNLYLEHRPPIVLADIKMPKLNGIELLKALKKLEGEKVEVIMISGHLDLEDAMKALQYGASRYITKPVDLREITAAISESESKLKVINERNELLRRLKEKVSSRTTELETAKAVIVKQVDFLQKLIDTVPEPITVLDTECRIAFANRASLQNAGLKELLPGSTCHSLYHASEERCNDSVECPVRALMQTGQKHRVVHQHIVADNKERTMEIISAPVFDENGGLCQIIQAGRDITDLLAAEADKREFEKILITLQKDQTITNIAGGIAHDFNRLLREVVENAELLGLLTEDRRASAYINEILKSSGNMASLVRQLLAYAKKGMYEQKKLNLNEVLRGAVRMVQRPGNSSFDILEKLAPDLWPIMADQRQMEQMSVNLLTNAVEAMENREAEIQLTTANVTMEHTWKCFFGHAHGPGDYVTLEVEDHGDGIEEKNLDLIFDPFFTTKAFGRGLGLAAVAGIVQNHDGCIILENRPGAGATFRILLPGCNEEISYINEKEDTWSPQRRSQQ